MKPTNRSFPLLLAGLSGIFFIGGFFWPGAYFIFLLVYIAAAILLASFYFPLPAFFALIILRTAVDFTTAAEVFSLGSLAVNYTSLVGLVSLIFAAHVYYRRRGWQEKVPLLTGWLLFLGLAVILLPFSVLFSASLTEFLRWSSFFALFLLGYMLVRNHRQATALIKAVIISSVLPAVVALWQGAVGSGFFDGDRWRVNGTFVHPNMLAFYLVLIITLCAFIFLTLPRQSVQKYIYLAAVLPLTAALVLTYTRGAWIALFIIILLIGLARFRTFLLAAFVVGLVGYLLLPPFQERINTLFSFSVTDSAVWRVDLWRDALDFYKMNPVFGTGPGTAPIIIGNYRSPLLGSTEPHNDYLKVLLETGAVGLALFLVIIISLLVYLCTGYRRETAPRQKLLFLFLLIFSISLYLSSLGDNILKDSSLQWCFWALIGALMARYRFKAGALLENKKAA